MKFLPIHPAMLNCNLIGAIVHNGCPHRVIAKAGDEWVIDRINCFHTQLCDAEELIEHFYIDLDTIRKLRPFKGQPYIKKYSASIKADHALYNGSARYTHAELKASLLPPLVYLPMSESFLPHLRKGMSVVYNGPNSPHRQGFVGKITDTHAYHGHSLSAHAAGIQVDWEEAYDTVYSQEWFAKNTYISTADILKMPQGKDYLEAYDKYIATTSELKAKQQPTYLELQRKQIDAHIEAQNKAEQEHRERQLEQCKRQSKHREGLLSFLFTPFMSTASFSKLEERMLASIVEENKERDLLKEPTSWLALNLDTGERLMADTEGGIKAKVALALAEDKWAEFQVFARVGGMKAEPTLKFFK